MGKPWAGVVNAPAVREQRLTVDKGDFDGDAMGLMVCLDETMAKLMIPLKPHKSAFEISRYRSISSNISIPKPVVATISSHLATPSGRYDQSAMEEFAC